MNKPLGDASRLRLCMLIPLYYTANNLHLQTQRLTELGATVLVVARKSPTHPQRHETYGTVHVTRVAPRMSGRLGNYSMMHPVRRPVTALWRRNGWHSAIFFSGSMQPSVGPLPSGPLPRMTAVCTSGADACFCEVLDTCGVVSSRRSNARRFGSNHA